MKNSKLKEEFEHVNESSGTSPHRYSKAAYGKHANVKCTKNLYWIGGLIGAIILWRCCQSDNSKKGLFSFLSCHEGACSKA